METNIPVWDQMYCKRLKITQMKSLNDHYSEYYIGRVQLNFYVMAQKELIIISGFSLHL